VEEEDRRPKSCPLGHKKAARANRVKFKDNQECIPPAARKFLSRHDLPRTLLQDKQLDEQCVDWQFVKSEFAGLVEATSMNGVIAVDMFTDGKGMIEGNTMCLVYDSAAHDAFKYPWIGTSFYGNPVYTGEFIARTLRKSIPDFSKDPVNTSCMFVLPDWPTATWYPLLDQCDIVKSYEVGSTIFTCPISATYSSGNLRPAGDEGGPDRVFPQGTK